MDDLRVLAAECDRQVETARARLIAAIRAAWNSGATQQQIAEATGRSQPEFSRLVRFQPKSPLGDHVKKHSKDIKRIIREGGGTNVRVFGSVAHGTDGADSDVDLLFTRTKPMGLMELGRLESSIRDTLNVDVDLVADSMLRPHIRQQVIEEATAL